MRELKNDYAALKQDYAPKPLKKMTVHPLFGYVIMSILLILVQILYMADIIPLNVSRAIMQTMVYVVAGLGVGVLLWLAGLISFATGAFMGLGTYLAAWILKAYMVPFVLVLAVVAVVGVIAGVVVGFVSLRVKGVGLLIITLALATVMSTTHALPNDFTGGPTGVSRVPFPELAMFFETNRDTMYFVILVVMFILIVITLNIINSPMGRAMMAMASSESLAQAMGIKLLKYRVLAFVIATVFALLSGVLYVSYMQSSIYTTWSSSLAMNILIAVCLGGTANPSGVLIGSFVMFTINSAFLQNIPFFQTYPQASLFFNGILIIVIIAKYPGGLIRLLGAIKNGVKRLAVKRRLYKYGPEE